MYYKDCTSKTLPVNYRINARAIMISPRKQVSLIRGMTVAAATKGSMTGLIPIGVFEAESTALAVGSTMKATTWIKFK